MPLYDYKIAKTVLSDKDKERFLCLFLSTRSDGTVSLPKSPIKSETDKLGQLGQSHCRLQLRISRQHEDHVLQHSQEGREGRREAR